MKTRRVGSFTCGVVLVAFGVMFLLHSFIPELTYQLIFSFWPVILIILGIELLVTETVSCLRNGNVGGSGAQKDYVEFQYDTGAVMLIFVMAVFSMGMGIAEYCMKYYMN